MLVCLQVRGLRLPISWWPSRLKSGGNMQKLTITSFKRFLNFYKNIWKLCFSLIFLIGMFHSGTVPAQDEESAISSEIEQACSSEDLHSSVRQNLVNCSAFFIQKGVDVNGKDQRGNAPLHYATWYGYKEVAALLIEKGADINIKDQEGIAPLHTAAWYGHKEVVALLIEKGADSI